MTDSLTMKVIENLADIPSREWDALAGNNPFMKHAFLHALQATGCASPQTGWYTQFLTLWDGDTLAGGMPLYGKTHTYGEFVFDFAWADAYQRHGLRYFPKLVCSVPFTPASGPRLLGHTSEIRAALVKAAIAHAEVQKFSSLHLLFPHEFQTTEIQQQGMMLRRGVQLHWRNTGFENFDAYLASMKPAKRRKIQQERRKVFDAGITLRHIRGEDITPEIWQFFMRCYENTHMQYSSPQPLNLEFFRMIGNTIPQHILLVVAYRSDKPIAAAINFYNDTTLFGRSWGALEYHPGLHFETCYYQGIEFCFNNGIELFEGGAQGEHKLARGFLPSTTWSAHWLAHPQFSRAVEDFLQRESGGVDHYMDELNDSSPFKKDQ